MPVQALCCRIFSRWQRLGYAVSFAAADLGGPSADLETMGVRCCVKPWYSCVEDVLLRHARDFDLVYLHRSSSAARYAALVRHHQPQARLLYSVADLLSLRLARQAVVQQRKELLAHSRQSGTMEWMAAWYADAVITHSTVEAQLLQRQHPQAKIHVVPWAVPPRPTRVPFGERKGVAFFHRPLPPSTQSRCGKQARGNGLARIRKA